MYTLGTFTCTLIVCYHSKYANTCHVNSIQLTFQNRPYSESNIFRLRYADIIRSLGMSFRQCNQSTQLSWPVYGQARSISAMFISISQVNSLIWISSFCNENEYFEHVQMVSDSVLSFRLFLQGISGTSGRWWAMQRCWTALSSNGPVWSRFLGTRQGLPRSALITSVQL